MQMFWDPEPANDVNSDQPVWCLGRSYKLDDSGSRAASKTAPVSHDAPASSLPDGAAASLPAQSPPPVSKPSENTLETPPASTSSSLSFVVAEEEPPPGRGWPAGFVEDMSSKFWMTYRSGFEPIPKSVDPKAASALSFSMRIKSTLSDSAGFSSDSGWGCMIRSGQSLLATTIGILRLGRGMFLLRLVFYFKRSKVRLT